MIKNVKRVIMSVVLGALAIAIVAGLGFAFVDQSSTANAAPVAIAQTSTTTPSASKTKTTKSTKAKKVRHRVSKTVLTASANALGISEATLKTDLKNGQSIADVAKAQNKDLSTVETAIVNALKTKLDTALKNGKITQAQHDKAVANLQTRVDKLVNRTFNAHTHPKKTSTSTTTSSK